MALTVWHLQLFAPFASPIIGSFAFFATIKFVPEKITGPRVNYPLLYTNFGLKLRFCSFLTLKRLFTDKQNVFSMNGGSFLNL